MRSQGCGIMERPGVAETTPAMPDPDETGAEMPERTCSVDGCEKRVHARGWCAMHLWRWTTHGTLAPRTTRLCSVEGCERKHSARGLCSTHAYRLRTFGSLDLPQRLCSIEGCGRKSVGYGWCSGHYTRWKRHGDVREHDPLEPTVEERFWKFVEKTDTCWLWTGSKGLTGYGQFAKGRAHRWSYEHFVGPIPDGLELDHLCRVRHCVNPAHLEPVTHDENVARRPRPTHCPHGHEYTPENTYVSPGGGRTCRICKRARWHAVEKNQRRARNAS